MKYLILSLLIPVSAIASFSRPELIARMMISDAFNIPDNTWCFGGEPIAYKGSVYLNCMDGQSSLMARWDKEGFKVLARGDGYTLLSNPVYASGQVSWYEFDEYAPIRTFVDQGVITSHKIENLGPLTAPSGSFLPKGPNEFFFLLKGETPELLSWKNEEVRPFFTLPEAAYIFTPQISPSGEIAIKVREGSTAENSPDRLWLYDGEWKVVFEDTDANPASPWKTFRHQLSIDGKKLVILANDGKGEALLLVENGKVELIARAGVDLKRFDFFTPKMAAGTIVVRGEDFEGRRAHYVKDNGSFRKLLTQGDIVHTDKGLGRVQYKNQDAIFYGSPGVDEKGNIYLQATLTDADSADTVLGVGLIKFTKE